MGDQNKKKLGIIQELLQILEMPRKHFKISKKHFNIWERHKKTSTFRKCPFRNTFNLGNTQEPHETLQIQKTQETLQHAHEQCPYEHFWNWERAHQERIGTRSTPCSILCVSFERSFFMTLQILISLCLKNIFKNDVQPPGIHCQKD